MLVLVLIMEIKFFGIENLITLTDVKQSNFVIYDLKL
jgi:hypothetical protein